MISSTVWGWGLVLGAGLLALYGLHRLALWLEAQGHLYYSRERRHGGGAMGSFVAIQEILEPQTRHMIEVKEEIRGDSEEGVPGAGPWPIGRSPWAPRDEPPA